MGKFATVLVAMGAFAIALVTLAPNSAEAGWRRWAWRTAPVTVYTDPGYVYAAPGYVYAAPGYYGPVYPPYPYATAYAYRYPYYGPYWRACRRGWC